MDSHPEKEKEFETILVIVVGFLVLYYIFENVWFLNTSIILGVSGLLSRLIRNKITKCWAYISEKIGVVMSKILLSIIFFIILTPVAILYRLFSKDLSSFTKRINSLSYYKDRQNYRYTQKDLEKLW